MKLNSTTDHAIRMLLMLAKNGGRVASTELAEEINLSRRYLFRIAARLRNANMITVTKGPEGGYALSSPPEDISLYGIIAAVEGPMQFPEHSTNQIENDLLGSVYLYFEGFFNRYTQKIKLDVLATYTSEELIQLTASFVANEKAMLFF